MTSPPATGRRAGTEAVALLEATLKLCEARLGPDHPDTLLSNRSQLAAAYLAPGAGPRPNHSLRDLLGPAGRVPGADSPD